MTAYDYPTARYLDELGVDMILVGDSLGMMMLGFPDTTEVTLEHMKHHAAAVIRGANNALVVVDMPINTYATPEQALQTAQELYSLGAGAVKLEGGAEKEEHICAIVQAGIPVQAHIGLLPQKSKEEGGFHMKGKTEEEAAQLLLDVEAVARAGAFSTVIECTRHSVARAITAASSIPTIGIGCGVGNCDGEVAVFHDVVGAFPWFVPGFAKPQADISQDIRRAITQWKQEITLPQV